MAVKDLNDLRYDKITGDKLYAIEWNTIVKSLQDHIKNFDVHLPITINEEDNTLSYKEGDKIYTFALNRKTGEKWGPLLINYVKRGDSTITEDNNHYYNIKNISATSAENIELLVSFKQQKYIDSVPQEGVFQYPDNTVTLKSDIQEFNVSISDTDNNNVKKLTITNIPDNSSYTETKEYDFEIEGSIGEGADNKKLVQFKLTQNAKDDTYGELRISEVRVNDGEIPSDEIPSAKTKIKIELIVIQEHNGQDEPVTEFEESQYWDYEGNLHNLETPVILEITVPANTLTSEKDRSLNVVIRAHGKSLEGKIPLTQVADEIKSYNEVTITNFSYNNLNYGANSSVSPSSSLLCQLKIIWKSGNVTYTTDGLSKSYSNSSISDSNVTINPNNGTVTKTTANESDGEITLGNVLLTVTGRSSKSNTATAVVKQNGTPVYPVYAGFVSDNIQTLNDSTPGISHYSTGYHEITCNGGNNVYFAILEKTINNPSLITESSFGSTFTLSSYRNSNYDTLINGVLYYAYIISAPFGNNQKALFTIN